MSKFLLEYNEVELNNYELNIFNQNIITNQSNEIDKIDKIFYRNRINYKHIQQTQILCLISVGQVNIYRSVNA